MTRKSLVALALATALTGCGRKADAPYPTWAVPSTPYEPAAGSRNAFDGYVLASRAALRAAPAEADRVAFSETGKAAALAKLRRPLEAARAASKLKCDYQFAATDAFSADPSAKGWRLLGRGMQWKIEQAIEKQEFDSAVAWTVVATKFGFDLATGDAQTASLGFTVCDEARRAVAPFLGRLTATQLTALHTGLAKVLREFPGLAGTVRNEETRFLLGVQYMQSAREHRTYQELDRQLGRAAKPAIEYLKNLSESKRPSYFQSMADAMRAFAADWEAQIDRPRPVREVKPEIEDSGPWRRFARAFTGTIPSMANIGDQTLAKTRILCITAWAGARVEKQGFATFSFKGLARKLVEDPYSGRDLVYASSGRDFKVYSVGPDGRDDGGDSQDVVLEDGL